MTVYDDLQMIFARDRHTVPLVTWTIYDHPKDHPDAYVARRFVGETPSAVAVAHEDIDCLRDVFARAGLVPLMRAETDDPSIIETWI